jgi:hypothetical protein
VCVKIVDDGDDDGLLILDIHENADHMLQEVHCLNTSCSSFHLLMNEGIRSSSSPSSRTLHTHTPHRWVARDLMTFEGMSTHILCFSVGWESAGLVLKRERKREREMGLLLSCLGLKISFCFYS